VWFAGKLVWDGQTGYMAPGAPNQDRVGTNRANGARFYPYGAEITSTANDHEKFATYQRDSLTGIDYADQRYYASSYGRFNTPDPGRSARLRDPGSWNRYVYASDDPVNRNDPTGKIDCWSWYDVVLNEGGGVIPDETTLGNCADGGGDNTSMEFDPCSVNADVLVALDVPMSCAAPPCYDAENSETCGGSSSGAPSAAQGGGSGAAGAPAVLSSFSFAQLQTQATAALNYELNNLGPNCDKVLPVGTLKSIESFTPLTFWNATTQGGQLASLLGGTNGGANATIGSYFGNGQYAVILNGAGGGFINQVVLGANFYSDPSSQGLTLLHELLHFALQKGDAGIDAHFGINVGVAGASASFSKWLANDCNN